MRILQISDTHLGAQWNARGPVGWTRADDHFEALERALQPALREEVDLVVHAGDVFDRSRPPARDVLRGGELLREVARRVPVLGIAGNHDRRGIARWLPHRSLRFTDVPCTHDVHGVRIGLLPYRRHPERFAADLARLGGLDLLVCHQGFAGSWVPGFTFRPGTPGETVPHLPPGLFVASGHIHPRQVVELDGSTVVHGGSTERTAFSEADQAKGSVIWELGARVSWRFVDHATRPMQAVPGGLVACMEDEVAAVRSRGCVAVVRRGGVPGRHRERPDLPLFS
ncbi:MAG: exonuclease SbcCD subunit D [Alphaproteobacteria bacterium]|nr:exonuclease SbcCD subunit D [Alphaproteobacteria bacterium]MCB9694359.1 exonuclease SbcCD subunit D [Alphaproteobacteria bacterium]